MPIFVKDAGTYKEANGVYIKDSGTWKESKSVFINNAGTWVEVFVGVVNINLSGLVKDFNLWDEVVSLIGTKTYKLIANVTMDEGTSIVSTLINPAAAFNVGSFPANSVINLNVSASSTITGRGGNGGKGSNSEGYGGYAGQAGGTAIYTRHTLNLTNNNIIGGGGGGGGGGGTRVVYQASGSGGGGAGGYHEATTTGAQSPPTASYNTAVAAGYGGIGAGQACDISCSAKAADGTLTTGGAPSNGTEGYRIGGAGGNLGATGVTGYGGTYVGGAAGKAIDGISYTNIITAGSILGGQVN